MGSPAKNIEHYTPSEREMVSARAAIKKLVSSNDLKVTGALKEVLVTMLEKIAEGQTVSLLFNDREYTTHEAADFLHVSRTFLLKEIDEGKIPCRMVGSHRRIRAKDLVSYKTESERSRLLAMKEMTKLSQEIEEDE